MFHLCFILFFSKKNLSQCYLVFRYMLLLSPINPSDATSVCDYILYFPLYSYVVINVLLWTFFLFSCRFVRPNVTEQITGS